MLVTLDKPIRYLFSSFPRIFKLFITDDDASVLNCNLFDTCSFHLLSVFLEMIACGPCGLSSLPGVDTTTTVVYNNN